MQAVDAAIYARLSGDAALQALVGQRVYRFRAPEGAAFPYVVFFKAAGGHRWTMGRKYYRPMTYVVKAVAEETAGVDAQTVACNADERIETLLNDALTVVGQNVECRRLGDVEYVEDDEPGKQYQHVGGTYRVQLAL